LVPTNRLTLHDGVWLGGDPVTVVHRDMERDPEVGRRVYELSGMRTGDLLVIDNGAPLGDAVLPIRSGGKACSVSSVTAALAAQMMIAEAVGILEDRRLAPPLYVSRNTTEADERNTTKERAYKDRLRRRGG
jgi:uncharacterized phosphosugar-binding protein